MSSIGQYRQNIQRYQILREQIERIISKLNNATDAASGFDLEIKSSYKVNGDSAVLSSRSTNLKNKISETSRFLSNAILPNIDSSIAGARRQIANLEEQERRRREEEQRRREEENRRQSEYQSSTQNDHGERNKTEYKSGWRREVM